MNHKIALIIPYYGKFNNYLNLWIHSAGYNKGIDFWVFTDNDMEHCCVLPENVKWVFMKFEDVKNKIASILNYKFTLHEPYKLCDYRPLYGLLFKEYIEGYDFWGHCDMDIIWGNLGKYITDDILEKYDRIYRSGHLCLYRNVGYMNNLVADMQAGNRGGGVTPKDVYTHKYSAHFDENYLIDDFLNDKGILTYRRIDCADIYCGKKNFICVNNESDAVFGFKYEHGELWGYLEEKDGKITAKEYSYIHLQKRKMCGDINDKDIFWITPDGFVENGNIESPIFLTKYGKPSKKYEWNMAIAYKRQQVRNILEGALIFRIKALWRNR